MPLRLFKQLKILNYIVSYMCVYVKTHTLDLEIVLGKKSY